MSRELDAEIAQKLFGGSIVWGEVQDARGRHMEPFFDESDAPWSGSEDVPRYSTDIREAWRVVEKVQELHPGWRFSILGGDSSYPYGRYDNGDIWVDRSRAHLFGWHARFFGGIDPEVAYPFSHGEAYAATPMETICRAALAALTSEQHPLNPSGLNV